MKKVPLKGLSEDTRQLLTDAEEAGGLVVEDENGQFRRRVYAYPEPTETERNAAWDGIKRFQNEVQKSFDEQGVSEDDLDRLLQEDS